MATREQGWTDHALGRGPTSSTSMTREDVELAGTERPVDHKKLLEQLVNHTEALIEAVNATRKQTAIHCNAQMNEKLSAALSNAIATSTTIQQILGPKLHKLKTDAGPFAQVWAGLKTFEVRKFDRDFRLGDELLLMEHDRETKAYSGAWIRARVVSMIRPGEYGLEGIVGVLGIEVLDKGDE